MPEGYILDGWKDNTPKKNKEELDKLKKLIEEVEEKLKDFYKREEE